MISPNSITQPVNPFKSQSKVNPQREDGHRRINSEVWSALMKADITISALKVCMSVIEHSWGFNQLTAKIGYAQFKRDTGLSRVSISAGIKEANRKHLLIVQPGNYTDSCSYLFNKYYDTWLTSKESYTGKETYTGTKNLYTSSKEVDTPPSKEVDTPPSKPPTSKVSLPIESNIETNNKNIIERENALQENDNVKRRGYGPHGNVLLSAKERNDLDKKLGMETCIACINNLDEKIETKGYKISNHYSTILKWHNEDHEKQKSNPRKLPDKYTDPEDYQPQSAVYTKPEEL